MNKLEKSKRIKVNYYFIIAGFLALLFSLTHELNGQQTIFPTLSSSNLDVNATIAFKYIWRIITAENFIFGIVFIIMGFYKEREKVRFTAWIICAILVARLLIIIGTTLAMEGQIKDLAIDVIAIIVYVMIILLGTRDKKQSHT